MNVRVLDYDTGKPIAGANVAIAYSPTFPVTPSQTVRKTGADGTVKMMTSTIEEGDVTASADGYLRGERYVHSAAGDRGRDDVTLFLVAPPAPDVVLIIPNGFAGMFFVEEQLVPDPPIASPGKRYFEFTVTADATIVLSGIPIGYPADDSLAGRKPGDFRARYADGLEILGGGEKIYDLQGKMRKAPRETDVAVRGVNYESITRDGKYIKRTTYIVGTWQEMLSMMAKFREARAAESK